ncbi:hypothetical protein B0H10DRAFT_2368240, partial [Mycena sp. CBHHK59/15]
RKRGRPNKDRHNSNPPSAQQGGVRARREVPVPVDVTTDAQSTPPNSSMDPYLPGVASIKIGDGVEADSEGDEVVGQISALPDDYDLHPLDRGRATIPYHGSSAHHIPRQLQPTDIVDQLQMELANLRRQSANAISLFDRLLDRLTRTELELSEMSNLGTAHGSAPPTEGDDDESADPDNYGQDLDLDLGDLALDEEEFPASIDPSDFVAMATEAIMAMEETDL